jgi:HAD superfamily phosphatase (TIGR01668 family)
VFKRMIPDKYVASIYCVDFQELANRGIKSVIVDLDNTLVGSKHMEATPELIEWLDNLKQFGFQVMIVSNNTKTRVSSFAKPLNIPFIYAAKKPFGQAFDRALKELNSAPHETVIIGDQLLTDVLGGNRRGLHTILVIPVSDQDAVCTKISRSLEKFFFRWMKRRGLIRLEENH